jgi:hypothetical protein
MSPTAPNPKWTPQHDDALAALTSLKLPAKEGRKLLEGLEGADTGDLIVKALRARHKGKALSLPGGPSNAAPITPPPLPRQTPPPLPGQMQLPKNMPPLPGQQPSPQITKAPIGPATAQLSSSDNPIKAAGAPPEKPRIRVRAAGGPVPAAPLGGAGPSIEQGSPTNGPLTPTAAPQPPSTQEAAPPRIRSEEEYQKLPPGQKFIWVPDGHIYQKPAEGGEQ